MQHVYSTDNTNNVNPFWYFHKTSKNIYPIEIGYKQILSLEVPYNKQLTNEACKKGCNLFARNGGCPPYSPDFAEIRDWYPYAQAIYARLFTRFYPPKVAEGNFYVRWNFVDALMARMMTRTGKYLCNFLGGILLNAGHCTECGAKRCAFKEGERTCRNPGKRTFSLESTGVLATNLMKQQFNIPLLWFNKKKPDYFPEYMIKLMLVLTKQEIPLDTLSIWVRHCFNSLPNAYTPPSQSEKEKLLARDWRKSEIFTIGKRKVDEKYEQ